MILKIKETELKKIIKNYYEEGKGFDVNYINFEFVEGSLNVMITASTEISGRQRDLYEYLCQQDVKEIVKSTMNKDVVISNISISPNYEVTIDVEKRLECSKNTKR
jgi:hypothetical protein